MNFTLNQKSNQPHFMVHLPKSLYSFKEMTISMEEASDAVQDFIEKHWLDIIPSLDPEFDGQSFCISLADPSGFVLVIGIDMIVEAPWPNDQGLGADFYLTYLADELMHELSNKQIEQFYEYHNQV